MNKIVIDTATLKALLGGHPEIEVELLAVAREKVAEELKRKLPDGYAAKFADDIMADLKQRINAQMLNWRGDALSDRVRDMVRGCVYDVLNAQTKAAAEQTARDVAEKAITAMLPRLEERLSQHQDALIKKINGLVGEEIERQINARLNAMMKLTEGLQNA
ncbi:hypothetical protein [Magnetospirillum molischianum]|uniref:Uncharacterized protein n=1 Tax=Magnetospirillum molischianum DSM 120 TaxID=1150626 RepID=H8FXX5_MAGML|nr:hypothetical protein [Magnetospirillum molischianum]CCG43213.1 hypothetical protein PHAMO_80004 [Magnetospirillum molischianum DSM 120]CCG43385.1 hypothetical protein PHAMO_80176 [Magnetospirillum molischianum DSM 120]